MKLLLLLFFLVLINGCRPKTTSHANWENYGGDKQNLHYSSLTEIDTNSVKNLAPAWIFHTGDADTAKYSQIQCNPIIIDSIIYFTSPSLKLFAVNAATGRKIWQFNPDSINQNRKSYQFILNNSRGVTYWSDGKNDKRIFFVASSSIHCIDAITGKLISGFGENGIIDLHDGLGRDVKDLFITATTPGIIYKDLYVIGSRVDEGPAAAPGHIRAFNVRTGKQEWIFHTIPQPGEYGYETWDDTTAYRYIGGANSWAGFSLDEKRGLLFVPTGSASFDFYGGRRKGQNLYANCLLALDAATGQRKWHYQFIHHDVWDRDLPTAPALVTIERDGKKIDAVVQLTKHGMVWLFERETGSPIYPINEVGVDTATTLLNEKLWSAQPIPSFSQPFVRQSFSENDINPYLHDTSIARIKKQLQGYRYGNMFIPPGKQTSVVFPGFDGGAEWGGPAVDPETGILYVNANEMAWLLTMKDNETKAVSNETIGQAGKRLYEQYCISCHGPDKKGSGNNPSLIGIQTKYTSSAIMNIVDNGRRMMPSFRHISEEERKAILSYVLDDKRERGKRFIGTPQAIDSFRNLPYGMTGYYKFLSPEGYPAIAPPWGTITAIDLNTGKHIWKNNLGEYPELKAKGIPATGTENYGGPVVTAGGILFIAATSDKKFRAFNKRTGQLLWEYDLPAAGFATPSIYQVDGKEYLVIACGGGKLKTKSGDAYLAFALSK